MVDSTDRLFSDLVGLLAQLRSSEGCPWDMEQTHKTLKRYLLEESYEVLEAIDKQDPIQLQEELGDVLLQVLFHSQVASETDEFTIEKVLQSIKDKLIRRHPHVFGDAHVKDAREAESNWEAIKIEERRGGRRVSILGTPPIDMPALAYSQLIQDRASHSGFDWETIDGVLEKVHEETKEINEAVSPEAQAMEFGDMLLALVNVGRWMDINTEDALRQANTRFYSRFVGMEQLARGRDLVFQDLPMEHKQALWQEVKGYERRNLDEFKPT